jgi:hypothetical protein
MPRLFIGFGRQAEDDSFTDFGATDPLIDCFGY